MQRRRRNSATVHDLTQRALDLQELDGTKAQHHTSSNDMLAQCDPDYLKTEG